MAACLEETTPEYHVLKNSENYFIGTTLTIRAVPKNNFFGWGGKELK